MPIYAYRCGNCGFQKDVLQKLSDPALTECPSCGTASFAKQLSAPAFQLKGTGWYVTDFRDNRKKGDKEAGKDDGQEPAKAADAPAGGEAGAAAVPAAGAPAAAGKDGKDGKAAAGTAKADAVSGGADRPVTGKPATPAAGAGAGPGSSAPPPAAT